jgi:hypothetical protein
MVAFGAAALVTIVAASIFLMHPGRQSRSGSAGRTTRTLPTAVGSTGVGPTSDLITVPDVRGLTVPKARARIIAAGLRLAGLDSTLGRPGIVEGVIPSPGIKVERGSGVRFTVGVTADRLASPT